MRAHARPATADARSASGARRARRPAAAVAASAGDQLGAPTVSVGGSRGAGAQHHAAAHAAVQHHRASGHHVPCGKTRRRPAGRRCRSSAPKPHAGLLEVAAAVEGSPGARIVLAPFFHAWERRLASSHEGSRRAAVRLGPRLAGAQRSPPATARGTRRRLGRRGDAATRRRSSTRRRRPTTTSRDASPELQEERRSRHAALSERARHAAPREQHRRRRAGFRPRDESPLGTTQGPRPRRGRAAAVELGREGHIGLSQLLARFGVSALRLSLPYHDARMPPELTRADYIVSSNIVRTVQVCRQAVLDARRAVAWLRVAGLRAHRHPRHEPRLVPGDADVGARAADPRAGAQPRLAVVRGRGVARPVDAPRARRARRPHRSRATARVCGGRSAPFVVPRSRARQAQRCSSTRSTT